MSLLGSYRPADKSEILRAVSVGDVLVDATRQAPDRTALVDGTDRRRWTFAQVEVEARRVAAALLGRFAPGERVAVWAPGFAEWVLLEYGAALAGVVLVTVNPAYRPQELRYVLGQSEAAGIFLVPKFRSPMSEYLAEVRPCLPLLREAILFSEWKDFLGSGSPHESLPHVSPLAPAQIQYTSGTTGFPKGAVLVHNALANNARFFADVLRLSPEDTYLNFMPPYHTAGCVLGVLGAAHGTAALVTQAQFDPTVAWDLIESEHATAFCAVPTMLLALLAEHRSGRRDAASLRVVVTGGSHVPAELVERVERTFGVTVSTVFGITECSPVIAQVRLDDTIEDRATTVGRPTPHAEVKIVDPGSQAVVPLGTPGELCVRGYLVMAGYHQMPEATAEAVDPQGWYHTGDLASMDSRGFLRVQGRLKEMIIRGGENIYTREIEDVLLGHPGIAEAAVVGIPDPYWGEVVVAFLRANTDPVPAPEELFALCRDKLAPTKTPSDWVFVDHFPLTPSGKIKKFELRDTYSAIRNENSADT